MRALDEVAAAIQSARTRLPQPVLSAFGLEDQFGRPLTPRQWGAIQRRLSCPLAPLEFAMGHWFLPDEFATVWDLPDHASHRHLNWEPPSARTEAAWREAQVFVGVRGCLANAGGLREKDVVRSARLKRDLGME